MSDTPQITSFADYYLIKADRERLQAELKASRQAYETCLNVIASMAAARDQLKAEGERLKELHNMQLVAIAVASKRNTDSTEVECHTDYKTVALSDVVTAVKREICERKEKEKWHDMAREGADCCNEVAAYGSCDCDLENDENPCVFCKANKFVARFNEMEKQP